MSKQSNFDSLPNSAFISRAAVQELVACSSTTLWRWVRDGKFPAPRYFSVRSTWNVGELRDWLQANVKQFKGGFQPQHDHLAIHSN